jgi:hypothetical protein
VRGALLRDPVAANAQRLVVQREPSIILAEHAHVDGQVIERERQIGSVGRVGADQLSPDGDGLLTGGRRLLVAIDFRQGEREVTKRPGQLEAERRAASARRRRMMTTSSRSVTLCSCCPRACRSFA